MSTPHTSLDADRRRCGDALKLSVLAAGVLAAAAAAAAPAIDAGILSGLPARNIGSAAMSGRIAAMDMHNDTDGKLTLYIGAASGGVWKSSDGGTSFKPVFDDQPVQSIGAVTIDPSDPQTVWVGTGEAWTRNSVSIGNGIYRSSDGGDSWTHLGLPQSERISRILVDPRAGDTVYACVPGKLWSDSADRGLYKTSDGGKTWRLVLKGANLSTGCAGLSMDAKNPDVLYASLWDFRRKGWTFRSGGEGPGAISGSGLYVSRDAGNNWREFTPETNQGFPNKPYGRIAVEVAPSDPDTVYAAIESADSALYVSEDGGSSWEQRDKSQWMVWRPFYFQRLTVDPSNAKRVFKDDGALIASDDGGKSFSVVGGFDGMHGDVHAVWINPNNPKQVISGDDGGLWLSYDGGNQWWKGENLPISQFYHVSVDDRDPYQVYGGLQDNSAWVGDSAYPGGITNSRWENMYGGDGFWMFSDPADPDYLYAESQGGNIARVNRLTHEARDIQPKAHAGEKLRFNWNTPIHLSPNQKGTLYLGSQFLFRTRDHGQSWERISPDLTSNDPQKQRQEESGGITVDNSVAEMHTTIYSISESPTAKDTIWVGTDDGNLQLTRDGGKTWDNMATQVPGLPPASWVSWVEASRHDPATAYATFDRHATGDMTAYLYVTRDYGRSWRALVGSDAKGVRGYAHVIKEDLVNPDLLFLGTEFGLWISFDGGGQWTPFKGGRFPAVAVRDIALQARDNDLVLATHGRGIWIVDDITALRSITPELLTKQAAFIGARPVQQRLQGQGGWANGAAVFVGENPPNGAVINYYQRSRHLFGPIKLEVLDADGRLIDTLPASKRRGLNRVVWSMREPPPRVPPAAQLASAGTRGPRVLPGRYTLRLTKGETVIEQPIEVGLDRRAKFNATERKAQYDAAMQVHALFGEESALLDRVNLLRAQLAKAGAGAKDDAALATNIAALDAKADAVRKQIVATTEGGAITGEERLREHTDQLYGAILSYEGTPGAYQIERIEALRQELAKIDGGFAALLAEDLPALNQALEGKGLTPIAVPDQVAVNEPQVGSANAHWQSGLNRNQKKDVRLALPLPEDFMLYR